MKLSSVTEHFIESIIGKMSRLCEDVDGINLAEGFPNFDTPEEIKKAAIEAIEQGKNQYSPSSGISKMRKNVSNYARDYNGLNYDPDTEVTITCGATEGLVVALMAVINPGDEVVVFEPYYETFVRSVLLVGGVPKCVMTDPPRWSYSVDNLRNAFNEKTKAVIINSPNNPTGKVFSEKELNEIASLCKKWDCFAISDEVYDRIYFDDAQHISIGSLNGMEDRTITINSISKIFSATGWRVGWTLAARPISERIRRAHDLVTVGAPAPLQEAATFALTLPHRYYLDLKSTYQKARDELFEQLERVGFSPYLPQGSFFMMAGTSELMERFSVSDSEAFSKALLERAGVASVPGSAFYQGSEQGKEQVRFCFAKTLDVLESIEWNL